MMFVIIITAWVATGGVKGGAVQCEGLGPAVGTLASVTFFLVMTHKKVLRIHISPMWRE